MIKVNSLVKVNDNYAGGLDNVIGREARVIRTDGTNYLLNIEGSITRKNEWVTGGQYTSNYDVLVTENEVEVITPKFLDVNGRQVQIGDKVAYAAYGGSITQGTVKMFKIGEETRWGNSRPDVVKVQLEVDATNRVWDGNDRSLNENKKVTRWYENSSQMIVLSTPFDFSQLGSLVIHE